ncbi:MAG: CBS domain-containing protein [Gammaproteobacteria bacterium]|nr:CBS domain-containing protein [Gammaproteobacteria bacterium]
MRDVAINRIMTMNPVTIGPDESVARAAELLESLDIHHLPVVEDGVLVGIMSSSDLLKVHVLRDKPTALAAIRVSQIMEPDPVTLDVLADLIDVATALTNGSFHALPVVESDNVLVGIVTSSDLINHLLMQIPRGDGSVHEVQRERDPGGISDADLASTLRLARAAADSGKADRMAEAVLHLREQNRLLKEVAKAAELYMRSGHGEHEHSVLIKALDVVRQNTPA